MKYTNKYEFTSKMYGVKINKVILVGVVQAVEQFFSFKFAEIKIKLKNAVTITCILPKSNPKKIKLTDIGKCVYIEGFLIGQIKGENENPYELSDGCHNAVKIKSFSVFDSYNESEHLYHNNIVLSGIVSSNASSSLVKDYFNFDLLNRKFVKSERFSFDVTTIYYKTQLIPATTQKETVKRKPFWEYKNNLSNNTVKDTRKNFNIKKNAVLLISAEFVLINNQTSILANNIHTIASTYSMKNNKTSFHPVKDYEKNINNFL
jgi:hypothetical protein